MFPIHTDRQKNGKLCQEKSEEFRIVPTGLLASFYCTFEDSLPL